MIAFPIDGLLCDTEQLQAEWLRVMGDTKYLSDAAFWAALKPYEDVAEFSEFIEDNRWDFYVFAERPKSLYLPTRAWLRNNFDYVASKDRLICPAIKRYDCRLMGVDVFIDTDERVIKNLKIETVSPITAYYVDRSTEGALMHVARRINESICSST